MTQLSKHWSLAELTKSQMAVRRGWNNQPGPKELAALKLLVNNILEPLRVRIRRAIVANSGFRGINLNKAIGGSRSSQHPKGEAADIEAPGMSNLELAQTIIEMDLPYDQLILEAYDPDVPGSGWVHVSHAASGKQRKQVLTATPKPGGGMIYTNGLPK